ncbi:hypothetical protein ACFSUK_25680 [Sphingobium scionense]|uniref:Uncharacterized protein n=1 Tax=Sphingobium scionense TaxID=1404341 RepID=A0A7W6LLT7_9SPHN|nr:hypothetical protein [Sphingobium scionense]MBB4146402.1 hypothetical protein [Sphingobium scionense]
MPIIPVALIEEYERYAERASAVEQAFRPRARAAIMREYPDAVLIISPTDCEFMGYSESRKTFIKGDVLRFPRWHPTQPEVKLRSALLDGKLLRQRIETHKANPDGSYWNSYHVNGFAFERIGAERLVEGSMYVNHVRIAYSGHGTKLEAGGFRSRFLDVMNDQLDLEGLDDTFVKFHAFYLVMNQTGTASFTQRVQMPGHDFNHSIYLNEVAKTFVDECEPLLALIEKIEGRFHVNSEELCDRYFDTEKDWEELGFV